MSLKSKIENDYENSLKSKDKIEISTYRLILSGIKDLEISNRSGPKKKETDETERLQKQKSKFMLLTQSNQEKVVKKKTIIRRKPKAK